MAQKWPLLLFRNYRAVLGSIPAYSTKPLERWEVRRGEVRRGDRGG
jgi:hypothetical protein